MDHGEINRFIFYNLSPAIMLSWYNLLLCYVLNVPSFSAFHALSLRLQIQALGSQIVGSADAGQNIIKEPQLVAPQNERNDQVRSKK